MYKKQMLGVLWQGWCQDEQGVGYNIKWIIFPSYSQGTEFILKPIFITIPSKTNGSFPLKENRCSKFIITILIPLVSSLYSGFSNPDL